MDIKKIKAIIDLVKESGIAELEISEGDGERLKITSLCANGSVASMQYLPPNTTHHYTNNQLSIAQNMTEPPVIVAIADINTGNVITSPMVG